MEDSDTSTKVPTRVGGERGPEPDSITAGRLPRRADHYRRAEAGWSRPVDSGWQLEVVQSQVGEVVHDEAAESVLRAVTAHVIGASRAADRANAATIAAPSSLEEACMPPAGGTTPHFAREPI